MYINFEEFLNMLHDARKNYTGKNNKRPEGNSPLLTSVDDILMKCGTKGFNSLHHSEKEILFRHRDTMMSA